MTRVIDGGCTPSRAANCPGVIGPHLYSEDKAEICVSETSLSALCALNLRFSRTTANLRRLASDRSSAASDTLLAYLTIILP